MTIKVKYCFPTWGWIILGILCSFPAFLFSYNHVLNMFYEYGCPLEDQGILAYLMWHNQLYLQLPPSMSSLWGNNYFGMHFSPIFSVTSLISEVITVNMIDFFAYFHGISHGLLSFALFFVLCRLYNLTSGFEIAFAFFLSLIFAFNGIAVTSMHYPHYEMLFVPLAVFFLAFLIQKKPFVALPFFIISLSIKECSGFHLFSLLFFVILIDILQNKKIYKPYLLYAALAFFYSISVLLLQKIIRSTEMSMIDFYVGAPPFSYLSWELIKERAIFIFYNKGYFYIPILIILIWSAISKRIYVLFGILAFLPWFLFNYFSISTWAAGLYMYYGNYYLLSFFWPLLAIKSVYGDNITQKIQREIFTWYSFIILASVTINNSFDAKNFILEPGVSQQYIFERLQTALLYKQQLGKVVVDAKVASLAPGAFSKSEILYLRNTPAEERRKFFGYSDPRIQELDTIDSVMFYKSSMNEGLVPFYALLSHLPYMYQVIGTNVYLASNKKLSELSAFASVLVIESDNQEKTLKDFYLHSIFNDSYYRKDVGHIQNTFEVHAQSVSGIVVYSNPVLLPKGQYCLLFDLKATVPIDFNKPILSLDVTSQNESHVLLKKAWFYSDLGGSSEKVIKVCFSVNENLPHAYFSVRFWHYQNAGLTIKDPKLE